MKLHLPKKLLAAVLSCVFAAGTTYAEVTYSKGTVELPNVININFAGERASTEGKPGSVSLPYGENLFDYDSTVWTTVNNASGTATVTDTLGNEYTLTWDSPNTHYSSVSTETLAGAITKGYLDMPSNGSRFATFSLSKVGGISWKQVNIIFSGDGNAFGKVDVAGTEYCYVDGTLTEVATGENPTWGTRTGSTTLTEGTNLMCVSNTDGTTPNTMTVTGKSNNGNRATIAGFQIVLGSTGTSIANTGTISGLSEGASALASGLGLDTSYNSTFTVNVEATADVTDDVALLTLDQNLRVKTLSVQGGALRLAINKGSSFSGSVELGSNASLTLSGSGKYVVANTSIAHEGEVNNLSDYIGATLGDDWTGTVLFDGGDFWGANLGSITKGAIELSGVSGMFARGDSTCTVKLILTDKGSETAAFSVNNGWGGDHVTFSGAVSGSGTLKRSASNGTNKTFTFTGDVSEWTGKFDSAFSGANTYNTSIEFSGNATTINASVTSTGDSLVNVTISNNSDVTMNGEIELAATTADRNGTLTLQGTGTKSFTNTVTAGNIAIAGGAANFTQAVTTKTLTVGAETTMSALNLSGAAAVNANLTVSGETSLSGDNASITLADDVAFRAGNQTITKLTDGTAATISGTGVVSVATSGITYTNTLIEVTETSGITTIAATLRNS